TASLSNQPKRDEKNQRRNIILLLEQNGALENDRVRESIIRRSRNTSDRNSEIARRDLIQAERKRRITKRNRELAEQEHKTLLQRLRAEFNTRLQQYLILTQERTNANRSYQDGIKSTLRSSKERFNNSGLPQIRERIQDLTKRLRNTKDKILDVENRSGAGQGAILGAYQDLAKSIRSNFNERIKRLRNLNQEKITKKEQERKRRSYGMSL
ncbi:hypothetical protein, partial [Prevotella sp. OH937_COT-195]|uniref:hypothetical protein n=1 Tax=Prevotella sp. OH937_COT-195 TaxID=2491051 RepID=UPI001F214B9D